MDGRGIAAALALGAAGVSLGTRFLASAESNLAEAYVTTLHGTRAEDTVVTDVITGRPARWVRNRLLDALVEAGAGTLGWGRQAPLMADLRRAAAAQGRADLLPMLAGEGAALSGEREPAAAIMARLERETEAAGGAAQASPRVLRSGLRRLAGRNERNGSHRATTPTRRIRRDARPRRRERRGQGTQRPRGGRGAARDPRCGSRARRPCASP